MTESIVFQTLPADRILEAAALAAVAFQHTASYQYVYGDDPEFIRSELQWLFERNIAIIHERNPEACYCGIDTSVSPDRLCCFFILADLETTEISFCQKVTSGVLWIPFRLGIPTFQRLLEISAYADESEMEMVAPDTPCLRLGRMVVHPDYQGKGVGSMCLGKAVEKANTDGMTIVLGTQSEKNVMFYSRLGFTVEKDVMWPPHAPRDKQFRWWYMKRVPVSKSLAHG